MRECCFAYDYEPHRWTREAAAPPMTPERERIAAVELRDLAGEPPPRRTNCRVSKRNKAEWFTAMRMRNNPLCWCGRANMHTGKHWSEDAARKQRRKP